MTKRCNKHVSAQRGFCALEEGHTDPCNIVPRLANQGITVPVSRKLVPAVPAHYIKVTHPEDTTVYCLGWTVGSGTGCRAGLRVADLTYIQTHWYVEPYSCNEGDYWREGEGQFICPKCEKLNRLYERPAVVAVKHLFKEVKDVHER